jgi:basic amino acid/polyamine antiporter, APA family
MANLLVTKQIKTILDEAHETGEHGLKRALGPRNLIALGNGAIIGTGIFVITGTATAQYAGPAIIFSLFSPQSAVSLPAFAMPSFLR